MIPQLTTQMSTLHLGTGSVSNSILVLFSNRSILALHFSNDIYFLFQYIAASPHPYPYTTYPPSIIHTMPLGDSEQTSNAASPDDSYQQYQAQQPK